MKKKKLKTLPKIILILLIIIVIALCITPSKKEENKNNNQEVKEENKNNNQEIKEEKNKYEKISYYKKENKKRYIAYEKENPTLTLEQIITYVNIGLDNPYYTNTKPADNLNTNLLLVNKYNYLTEDYVPSNLENISTTYARSGMQLVKEAKEAFETLSENAKKDGMNVIAMSSYRSYNYQVNLYNNYVAQDGKEAADKYSARPGYSEHQTGLAVDVYNLNLPYTSFEETEEFTWMQENAYKYGFILRFPKDKVDITGYQYESWHYRYVGKKVAKEIKDNNLTLEEYIAKKVEN